MDTTIESIGFATLRISLTVGPIIVMIVGLWMVYQRIKVRNEGFTPNTLKAIGLVLFIPLLPLVLANFSDLRGEGLAVLLGTIAGYVLSNSGEK